MDRRFPGLRRVFRIAPFRRDVTRDVEDELAFHLERKIEELVQEGWTRAAAEAEARRRFGDYEHIREEVETIAGRRRRRTERRERMGRWRQDLRYAVRQLGRHPGFALVATLTLALGIGATTAIFSVVDGVLLQGLPYPDADRLVRVWVGPERSSMSYLDIADVETETDAVETLVGYSPAEVTLTGEGDPTLLQAARVTQGMLGTFALSPALGRDIRPDEFGANPPPIVVIGHGLWQRLLGGRTDILGQTLELDGVTREVIGVAPEGFGFPDDAEIWIPRQLDPEGCARGCHTFVTVGRLVHGVTLDVARQEVEALATSLQEQYPDTNFGKSLRLVGLQEDTVGDVQKGLWIVLASVIAVLLIACANVANLLLVRATSRTGEMAVRGALGASRGRLTSQLLVESGLLALLGGTLGVALAWLGVRLLRGASVDTIPRIDEVGLDGGVLLFTALTVGAVTLLVGLIPALRASSTEPGAQLAQTGRSRGSASRRGPRRLLVTLEVGLSVVLLVAAGLLLRSFHQLYSVDLGYDTTHMTRFRVTLPSARYDSLPQIRTFFRALEARLESLPGVTAVGSGFGAPLARGNMTGDFRIEGRPEPELGQEIPASVKAVSPGYLETMRIAVVQGRPLLASDDASEVPVALINETMARRAFPGENPIGQRVGVTADFGWGSEFWEVVGVVRDIRSRSVSEEPEPELYLPQGQFGPGSLWVTVRSERGSPPSRAAVQAELYALDPYLPVRNYETVEEALSRQVAPTRFYMLLLGLFAGLALLLAAVGIYGVLSYLVSTRTQEIGVRVALGADRVRIVRMTLSEGLAPALLGVGLGLAAALVGSRLLESLLYGVTPRDPLVLALIPALLLLVALVAVTLPSLRAARIDPAVALRSD